MDDSSQPQSGDNVNNLSNSRKDPPDAADPISASEAFENAPPEVSQMLAMMMSAGPVPSPIAKQVRPEHIDKSLELADRQADREHRQSNTTKICLMLGLLIAVGLVVFLVVVLKDAPELLEKVLALIIGLFAGFLGGFGAGKIHTHSK